MISAQHLSKHYRRKTAVDDISFNVENGKVTGFLGPNGAGKSTTMRLMLGLDQGGGQTLFDDKPLHTYTYPAQVVGILLEAKAFHPTRTARNHLRILAEAGNIPMQRVDEALDTVGLRQEARGRPGKFSLGMAQRLGIAAAILGKPKYLILDEPANGLDPEGMAWLRHFITDYAEQGGAVFISSHLLSEISQMADNVVVIGKGKLIASTPMANLLAAHATVSVFVRSSNISSLEKALKAKGLSYKHEAAGVSIDGTSTDQVGKLAFDAGVPILELSTRTASLEQAFLEMTETAEEYKTHADTRSTS